MQPTNYSQGHHAEVVAANYLVIRGFTIIAINWKTRWCEVDIVARKSQVIYFVEVKYRKTSNQGMGLDYVTPKKLRQMQFAAEFWIQTNSWDGECQLAALEIAGDDFHVSAFVPELC